MWTEDSTEGFTSEELAALNAAQERLETAYPGVDAANIADALNNAFFEGVTADQLFAAASARFEVIEGESA